MTRIEELKALEHLKRRVNKITSDPKEAQGLCLALAEEFGGERPADTKQD